MSADGLDFHSFKQAGVSQAFLPIDRNVQVGKSGTGPLTGEWGDRRPTASLAIVGDLMHFISAAETSPTGSFYTHLAWRRASTQPRADRAD